MPGLSIRGGSAVATLATVAGNLAANRGRSTTHAASYNPQRTPLHQPAGDLLALGQRRRQPGASQAAVVAARHRHRWCAAARKRGTRTFEQSQTAEISQ